MLPLHQGSLCSLWSLGVRGDHFSLGHLVDLDLPWNRTHMHIFVVRWKARTFIFHESTYTQHRSVSCVLFISELERRMRQRTREIPAVLWWEVGGRRVEELLLDYAVKWLWDWHYDKHHPPWRPPFQPILVNRAHRVVPVNLDGLCLQLALSLQIYPEMFDEVMWSFKKCKKKKSINQWANFSSYLRSNDTWGPVRTIFALETLENMTKWGRG